MVGMIFLVIALLMAPGSSDRLYLIANAQDALRTTSDVQVFRGDGFSIYIGENFEASQTLDQPAGNPGDYFAVYPRLLPPGWAAAQYGTVLFDDGEVLITKPGPSDRAVPCAAATPLRPLREPFLRGFDYTPPAYDENVADIVAGIEEDSLISIIGRLEQFENRFWSNDSFPAARDWAIAWLQNAGCEVQVQQFPVQSGTSENLIVFIPGTVHPNRFVLMGAHLDSGHNGNDIFPGADDNASGAATVMEAARSMIRYNCEYSVLLCLWGAEEAGLVGSYYFASNAASEGDSILAALNLDMILYGPVIGPIRYDIAQINYNEWSLDLAEYFVSAGDIYVPDLLTDLHPTSGGGSDHVSFWQCGYTAIGGNEYLFSPWYHTADDLLANSIEFFPFGTSFARATTATLASLAVPAGLYIDPAGHTQELQLSVSPFPASRTVEVFFGHLVPGAVSVQVFDLSGRLVRGFSVEGADRLQIDVNALSTGMYFARVTTATESATARLLVVR